MKQWLEKIKRFDRLSGRNQRITYYTVYSILFCFVTLAVFSWFFLASKSFVWETDGIPQHFNALAYYGQYLRGIIRNFFSTGKLSIPMFDFNIGYGSDIITTLHYYVLGDPLTLLSAIVPVAKTEFLYSFLIILRFYLAGVSFSMYCNKMGRGRSAVLCGSFVYAFCGYALFAGVRHPYFINPMIYFPLLLLGVEKIFRKEKPYLFISMIFLSAVSNFYFFYMLGILMVVYAGIRFFFIYKEDRIRHILLCFRNFLVYCIIGILMAAVILLPNIIIAGSNSRISNGHSYDLFYSNMYYEKLLLGFIDGSRGIGYWTYLGYGAISLLAVVLLFTIRKKYTWIKICFAVMTLFLMFPFAAHVLHGFSYVANRWIWGYSFIVALIVTIMIPEMLQITKKQLIILALMAGVCYCIAFTFNHSRIESIFASLSVLLLSFILLFFTYIFRSETILTGWKRNLPTMGILFSVILGIIIQAGYRYSASERDYISEFAFCNKIIPTLKNTSAKSILRLKDKDFFRYEESPSGTKAIKNTAMFNKLNSTSSYFSMSNSHVYDFLKELNVRDYNEVQYLGLDGRTVPAALASTKYFVVVKGKEAYLPFGYSKEVQPKNPPKKAKFSVYENEYALPLGYTYRSYVSREKYEELTPLEKQQALIQGIVIEETQEIKETNKIKETELSLIQKSVPYEMTLGDGIEYEDGKFIVNNTKSKVLFTFKAQRNCELYLYIKNLHYQGVNPLDNYTKEKFEKLSNYKKHKLKMKYRDWKEPKISVLTIRAKGIQKAISIMTPDHNSYIGRHDLMSNLCYSEKFRKTISITFGEKGIYTFDDIQVIRQSMKDYGEQVNALREDALENVSIGVNEVKGTIQLDEPKALCLSIPYSSGWEVFVDGKKEKLLNANTMYMGVLLDAGNHEIQLKYQTPGIKIGFFATLTGCFAMIFVIVFHQRKRKKEEK